MSDKVKHVRRMKIIDNVVRYFVGILFNFSGMVKVNDPSGTAIKLKEYFEKEFNNKESEKTIDTNTIDMLVAEAEKGKLKTKKEVVYDEVNRRVIRLTILSAEPHTDHYVYKPETLTQREKSRKSARNKLFRKNRRR